MIIVNVIIMHTTSVNTYMHCYSLNAHFMQTKMLQISIIHVAVLISVIYVSATVTPCNYEQTLYFILVKISALKPYL